MTQARGPGLLLQDEEVLHVNVVPAMRCLQYLVTLLQTPGGRGTRGQRYSNKVMVAMHLLAVSLSNRREATKVAQQALQAAFQRILPSENIVNKLPSASYLSARMVCFDSACMLVKQELERRLMPHGVTRWLWADSSVQGRRDWLQVKEL